MISDCMNCVQNRKPDDFSDLNFDQLIWEFGNSDKPDWIHVSFNEGRNRGEVLRAERLNGKTFYTKMA